MVFDGYGSKLPKIIDKSLKGKKDIIKSLSLRILVNNIPLNWKKFEMERCPLCFKKWTKPLLHILTTCSYLNNTDLCKTDKNILSLEIIINHVERIIKENLNEMIKLTTKSENEKISGAVS